MGFIMNENLTWMELEHPDVMSGRYMISEYGDIYSKTTNKILKPFTDKDGYKRIELSVSKNNYKKFYVHRLVGWMFVDGYTEERNIINHKNSIRDSNHYSNLEWVTHSENDIHGYKCGFRENNNVVYDENFIREICQHIKDGYKNKEILKMITGSDDIDDNKKVYTLISRLRHKSNWVEITDEYF